MLITSSFILNATGEANQYTIYPWVSHFVGDAPALVKLTCLYLQATASI
jgi:hypothetical protein